jgi:hypothetical protein
LSLFDTVFVIVFINKKDLPILLYWVIFYICRQMYDPYKSWREDCKKTIEVWYKKIIERKPGLVLLADYIVMR